MKKLVLWVWWAVAVTVVAGIVNIADNVPNLTIRIFFGLGIVVGILIVPIASVVAFAYTDWIAKKKKDERGKLQSEETI